MGFYLSRAEGSRGTCRVEGHPSVVCLSSVSTFDQLHFHSLQSDLNPFSSNSISWKSNKKLVALATRDPIDLQRENACHQQYALSFNLIALSQFIKDFSDMASFQITPPTVFMEVATKCTVRPWGGTGHMFRSYSTPIFDRVKPSLKNVQIWFISGELLLQFSSDRVESCGQLDRMVVKCILFPDYSIPKLKVINIV